MGQLVAYLKGTPGPSGFGSAATAMDVTKGLSLESYTAIITGATAGIGKETARALAKRGARVVLAIRNLRLGEELKAELLKENMKARIEVIQLDLSDLSSVRKFAADFKARNLPLNILVNNGGISSLDEPKSTPQGLELMFATNYLGHFLFKDLLLDTRGLISGIEFTDEGGGIVSVMHAGHFLLTDLLLDTMKTTATQSGIQGRIVVVSGAIYTFTYEGGIAFDKLINSKKIYGFKGYGQSKLANILHCQGLSRRLQEEGTKNITVNCLHPGAIRTNLTHIQGVLGLIESCLPKFIYKTVEQGAATQTYLAAHPDVEGVSGKYFMDCNESPLTGHALDSKLADRLWKWSEDYVSTH